MNKIILGFRKTMFAGMFFLLTFSSCVTQKNVTYFQDATPGDKKIIVETAKFVEPIIQPDDILSITIRTLDPAVTEKSSEGTMLPILGGPGSGSKSDVNGFLVDKNGEIELLIIGKVKVAGLTTSEARDKITKLAVKDYVSPNVQVRFANFKITILGEVARPATYTLPNEKVTILDALGLAGDLTIYGMRENIRVVRQVDGKTEMGFINLNTTEVFNSPYFYLRQNDAVYVEPNKAKIATTDASRTRLITIGASITSAVIVLLLRLL